MINLLPQVEKRKLQREYYLRIGIVVSGLVFILEILTAGLFSPSYFLISEAEKALKVELAAKKALTPIGGEDAQKKIAIINAELALLNPINQQGAMLPSQVIMEILSKKPSGIDITSFAYGKTGASSASAQLSGVAGTREDLLAFQRMLKENSRFGDIKYAQSFITKRTDIDFQLTVMVK